MRDYIFYTTEGHTIAPKENVDVENCQVLGISSGNNIEEAEKKLLNDNPWIEEAGFSDNEFLARQILTDELRADLKYLLNYISLDETTLFGKDPNGTNRIIKIVENLKAL